MKSEIILKLEELLSSPDVQSVAGGVRAVQKQYEEVFQKELEKAREEFIQEGGKSRDFIYAKSQEDEKIIQLLERFR